MNEISILNKEVLTMSSREIAKLLNKQHSNIMISAERLADKGVIGTLAVQDFEHNGNIYREYLLNKRDSLILVAQNCPEFTAAIVDRWQELENANKPAIPKTLSAALFEAGRLALEVERQAEQLAIAKTKTDFVDRYVESSTGCMTFRSVAKQMKVKERELRAFLRDNKIMYRLGGDWVPYENHINAGRFEVKAGLSDGNHAFSQSKFTPKGFAWLAGEYAKRKAIELMDSSINNL